MSITTETREVLPTGTWTLDQVHSTIGFEVEYLVGAFRGQFNDVEATLANDGDGISLAGSARVGSIEVKDENLSTHLQSPDFFDAEQNPQLRFVSMEIHRTGNEVAIDGEITIKGETKPIELQGTITDPAPDPFGNERFGLKLEGKLDRTSFGVSWNNPLPSGEPALANDVTLIAELQFVKAA